MNTLLMCEALCAGAIGLTWILAVITREYSWVDRIWSLIPIAYMWIFAAGSDFDTRLVVMSVLVTLWGARLTFNYGRKGGYAPGGEDYRWGILRERMKPWQFQVFNLLFIAGYQNVLLLLITMPAYTALTSSLPFGPLDAVLALAFLCFLLGETVADQQQWNFHQWKKAERSAGREPTEQFLTTGLFRFSRHPNFFCEQAQWWVLYAFAVHATGTFFHWTMIGPVLLTLLFHGSTNFTEEITKARYPGYGEYQKRTSRLFPLPPREVPAARVAE